MFHTHNTHKHYSKKHISIYLSMVHWSSAVFQVPGYIDVL